jgi:uncharacterized protein (DUF362 family)
MDALEVFVSGGPESGETASPGVIMMSQDRVALDACGVVLLRVYRAGAPLDQGSVFQLDQIRRAVDLNLGISSADQIEFLAPDAASKAVTLQIQNLLAKPAAGDTKNR